MMPAKLRLTSLLIFCFKSVLFFECSTEKSDYIQYWGSGRKFGNSETSVLEGRTKMDGFSLAHLSCINIRRDDMQNTPIIDELLRIKHLTAMANTFFKITHSHSHMVVSCILTQLSPVSDNS